MTYTRTLTPSKSGPLTFSVKGDLLSIQVVVGGSKAEAILSTTGPEGGPDAKNIDKAKLEPTRNGVHLELPETPGGGGGVSVFNSGGGMSVMTGRGGRTVMSSGSISVGRNSVVIGGSRGGGPNVVIDGDQVYVDGKNVTGGGDGKPLPPRPVGIKLTLQLPRGSSFKVNNKDGDTNIVITGEALEDVDIKTYGGNMELQVECEALNYDNYNGSLYASGKVKEASAETYNGNVTFDQLYGGAQLVTYNGNVNAACYARGRVSGKSYNGDVTIRDAANLGDTLKVKASTYNGRTRTPNDQ